MTNRLGVSCPIEVLQVHFKLQWKTSKIINPLLYHDFWYYSSPSNIFKIQFVLCSRHDFRLALFSFTTRGHRGQFGINEQKAFSNQVTSQEHELLFAALLDYIKCNSSKAPLEESRQERQRLENNRPNRTPWNHSLFIAVNRNDIVITVYFSP